MHAVHPVDATLREGEQAPGVALTRDEKLEVAAALVAAGVPLLDAGMPCAGAEERAFFAQAVAAFGPSRIGASLRVDRRDLERTLATGARELFVILPVSPLHVGRKLGVAPGDLAARAASLVEEAVGAGATVSLAAEDASRASPDEAAAVLGPAVAAGATRIFACDTVGVWLPSRAGAFVRGLGERLPQGIALGVHCHDDHGLALANTLAAVEAGATWPSVTVNGLGERCGNADLAALVGALEQLLGLPTGIDRPRLHALSRRVEALTGVPVRPGAPLVGEHAFTHTSGVHVDGVLKDPRTYEGPDPAPWGRRHRVALSPRSGRSALRAEGEGTVGVGELEALRYNAFEACRARRDRFWPSLEAWRRALPVARGEPPEP